MAGCLISNSLIAADISCYNLIRWISFCLQTYCTNSFWLNVAGIPYSVQSINCAFTVVFREKKALHYQIYTSVILDFRGEIRQELPNWDEANWSTHYDICILCRQLGNVLNDEIREQTKLFRQIIGRDRKLMEYRNYAASISTTIWPIYDIQMLHVVVCQHF